MLMATDNRRRVKVYLLNDDRQWDDKGTGHVTVKSSDVSSLTLIVTAEDNGSLLLESKVQADTAYHKQCETLIVWSENDNTELALSFQERAGCDEIWAKICQVQGKDPATTTITQEMESEEADEEERFEDIPDAAMPIELPPCQISKLFEIRELFDSAMNSPIRRERLAIALQQENYIPQLIDIFHMCEDVENTEELHVLFDIFKTIFMLNKNSIFEIMFTEDLIFEVLGILEYDPTLSEPAGHRQFIRDKANFKECIPFSNPSLIEKIHQTYRVQYIQVFLSMLFQQLQDENLDTQKRIDLASLLREFCTFSNTLQIQSRTSFLRSLANKRLFPTIETLLGIDVEDIWAVAADILSFATDTNPSLVRDYMVQEASSHDEDALLINIVIERIVKNPGCNAEGTLLGLLRTLIDPENMLRALNRMEKSEFLAFFYKYAMHRFTEPVQLATHGTDCLKYISKSENTSLIASVLDVLAFAVENHTYHVKNYILSKEILQKVLLLMNPRYSFLALNALKFFRKIIGLKDEFYNRYIIKFDLMKYIVDAYVKNGVRQNMLNSAVLEMFEFIKIEDIKTLIRYTCERHIEALIKVEACPTFNALKTKYEQQLERQNSAAAAAGGGTRGGDFLSGGGGGVIKTFDTSRFRRDPRDLEVDEENYFNSEDDGGDGVDLATLNKPLYNSPVVVQSKVFDSKPPPNKVIGGGGGGILPTTTTTTATTSPTTTPLTSSSPLVDYADDSDDDDASSTDSPDKQSPNKRQKVSSTVT